jgi:hypothetical protein
VSYICGRPLVKIDDTDSEMGQVLEHCLRSFPEPTGGRIATAKAHFKAWRKQSDIEADIVRLKERVQACHFRFTVSALSRYSRSPWLR